MAELETLKALTGTWSGQNSLWFQPGTPAHEAPAAATISTVAAGKIVSVDYTWAHEGEPQDGRILIAVDPADGVHMAWCDSFHMDTKIMDLTGPGGAGFVATGAYTVPDSEPWGWRIEIETPGADQFHLRMYNILPPSMGGVEALAVEAAYTRG